MNVIVLLCNKQIIGNWEETAVYGKVKLGINCSKWESKIGNKLQEMGK